MSSVLKKQSGLRGAGLLLLAPMTNGKIENVYEFPAKEETKSLVILLHGLGSNGQDLISLAPMWAMDLPQTTFVSPDAPFVCDMVPPGYPNSYQWFSLQSRDPESILTGVETAFPILKEFIEAQLKKYAVSPENLVLCGFSQGTMMSLYTAPRLSHEIAGVLGYSGALVGGEELLEGGEEVFNKPPVHLIHGEADDVVPVSAWHDARKVLEKAGFELSGHTAPGLPHSIDDMGIDSGLAFMKSVLY